MKKYFKDFQDIAIPAFLQNEKWEDVSWGNDAAPRVQYVTDPACPYELTVWVQHPNPAKRELSDTRRFSVVVYEKSTGDELEGDETDSPAEARRLIDHWERVLLMLEKNRKNADENVVSLIASGYFWTCKNCGIDHNIPDTRDAVTCDNCGTQFTVIEAVHSKG